jgi:hypothetical protein
LAFCQDIENSKDKSGGNPNMKLRDFVRMDEELYKADQEFEDAPRKGVAQNDEKTISNEGKDGDGSPSRGPVSVVKNVCSFCKKPIKKSEAWEGDMMGRVYHRECFDQKFDNKDPERYGSQYPDYPEGVKPEHTKESTNERSTTMAKPKTEAKKPVKVKKPVKK